MSADESEPLLLNDLVTNINRIPIDCVVELTRMENDECGDSVVLGTSVGTMAERNPVQEMLLESKKNRNINNDMPLPEGKEAHLFISYSSDDSSTVHPVIVELEQTHRMACIFDERDFIPGMDTQANIKRSMERSMKVLLFLSDNFLQSGYCKYENSLAFAMSMATGRNIIIPVKLDESDVPSSLETLTYIEGDSGNLAERIVEAYNSMETDFIANDFRSARNLENGYSITLACETESSCCLRPTKTKVVFNEETRRMLKTGNVQVSEEIVKDAADIANSYISTGRLSRSNPSVFCCLWLCTCPFIVLTTYATLNIIGVTVYEQGFSQKTVDVLTVYSQGLFWFLLIAETVITLAVMFLYYWCRLKADKRRLKADLFKRITLKTYMDGVYFKVFLASKIKQYVEENYGRSHDYSMEEYEERADFCIKNSLSAYIYYYVLGAPDNRHNVIGGRSCLCQFLEPYIGNHVQSWLGSIPAHQIEVNSSITMG